MNARFRRWFVAVIVVSSVVLLAASCASSEPSSDAIVVLPTREVAAAPTPPPATAEPTPAAAPTAEVATTEPTRAAVVTGLGELVETDFALLAGKRVGVIANATSMFNDDHLIDLLHDADDVELVAAFAPEHGIRGIVDAGASVSDTADTTTGTPIFSLYGAVKSPTAAQLSGIDVLVYDLQDVGARYYTYISTLGLAMQSAAASDVAFVVLDRPNPLGGNHHGGFIRQPGFDSFVSQYPIPSVYGLTAGELASAIVGEGWLPGLDQLDLTVVTMRNWHRSMGWSDTGFAWRAPSPGLPAAASALTYPATVLFEATDLSYGKGTAAPFQMIGAPWLDGASLASDLNGRNLAGVNFAPVTFTPSNSVAPNARHADVKLGGIELTVTDAALFDPASTGVHLLEATQDQATTTGRSSIIDRPEFFDLLAGSSQLRSELAASTPAEAIVASWAAENAEFDAVRSRYLLY